jgi:transposase InsO family protein
MDGKPGSAWCSQAPSSTGTALGCGSSGDGKAVPRLSAGWVAQQLREAFPFTSPPKYLLRDRDSIYGLEFERCVDALGLEQLSIAPRSPWQSPYVERFIGSLRRECLDQIIVLNQAHLRRVLQSYLAHYHGCRTHLRLPNTLKFGQKRPGASASAAA